MHELGIMQNLIDIARAHAGERKVVRVCIEVGRLTAVLPEAMQFCFQACAEKTSLDGAVLEINEVEGLGVCRDCKRQVALNLFDNRCQCGSLSIECLKGQELKLVSLEVL